MPALRAISQPSARRWRSSTARCAALLAAGVLCTAVPTPALRSVPCSADCNGDDQTAVNEVIICVQIALGSAVFDSCSACDADRSGELSIDELVLAVSSALGLCHFDVFDQCGDGTIEALESCDDGNDFGGDGCAINCTVESTRVGTFDPAGSSATLQTEALPVQLELAGVVRLRSGQVADQFGSSSQPGDLPVVIRAGELRVDPIPVTGLVCACVRAVPLDAFGVDVAASGVISCGSDGPMGIDYRLAQDHNTDQADPANRTAGSPDDPECDDRVTLPGALQVSACREGSAQSCPGWDDARHIHVGVCNGPPILTRSGGAAARGSALIFAHLGVSFLADRGTCSMRGPEADGSCRFPDYGPDCLPCTDDDLVQEQPVIVPLTTGVAEAAVFDANNSAGGPVNIEAHSDCFGMPCRTSVMGMPFDCDALIADPTGGLSGGVLAFAFPALDSASSGDLVATGVLAFE